LKEGVVIQSLAFAVLLLSTAAIEVNTDRLADGATQTFSVGSRQVAVHKSGDTTTVRVQELDRIDTVTLTVQPGRLSIAHKDNGVERRFIVLDRPRVVVDGIDLEPYLAGATAGEPGGVVPLPDKRPVVQGGPQYYICPKDEVMLRLPNGPANRELHCPLDGTLMKRGMGPQSQYWLLQ
jgi:hypothetical protein